MKTRLSDKQLSELSELYRYTSISLHDLKKRFNLTLSNNDLVKLIPPEPTDHTCPYCGCAMVRKVTRSSTTRPYCPSCNHQLSDNCFCSNCKSTHENNLSVIKNENLERLNKLETMLKDTWLRPTNPLAFSDFSTRHKILTCILLSWKGIKFDNTGPYITNISKKNDSIFPDEKTTYEILQELLNLHIIKIDDKSIRADIHAFNPDDCSICDYAALIYRFIIFPNDCESIREYLSGRYWLTYEDFVFWWRWITLAEARSYYYYLSKESFLNVKPIGERIESQFQIIIENESLAFCKYVMGLAIKEESKWTRNQPRGQYSNGFLRRLKYIAERFGSGDWNYTQLRYTYYYHSSATPYILNNVLLIGTEGIFRPISSSRDLYELYKERFFT